MLEEIARGGMGVVYKARQVSLNRLVAVKMILTGEFASEEFVRRFRKEAEAAANLAHPNIVAIHEVGEHEGQHYFSMDYVEGKNLADLVREGPLAAKRAAAYLKTIAEAIHYAHQRGVLHRDLKPSNILVDQSDQPLVTDFGLAKRLASKSETRNPQPEMELTLTGQVLGSPNFMPPEQAAGRGDALGPPSDVYSLGAVLYHLLTARPPFVAETVPDTLRRVMEQEPLPPRLLNPGVPRDLETICLKCLEKEPAKRYFLASVLAEELGRYLRNEPIQARPVGPSSRMWRWCQRKPQLAASLALMFLVFAVGVAGILWQWWRAEKSNTILSEVLFDGGDFASYKTSQGSFDVRSHDGRWRATANNNTVQLFDLAANRPLTAPLLHEAAVSCMQMTPDDRLLVTACADNSLRSCAAYVWQIPSGTKVATLQHDDGVLSVSISADGKWVVTASEDRTARLWNLATGQPLRMAHFEHPTHVVLHKLSSDGKVLVTACRDMTVWAWSTATGTVLVGPLRHEKPIVALRLSRDGHRIMTFTKDGRLLIWDATSGRQMLPPF